MNTKATLAGVGIVLAAAGCGGATTATAPKSPTQGSTAAASGATITIRNFDFGGPLSVAPGQRIQVVDKDSVPHTATSGTAFNVKVQPGAMASFNAPTKPGSYPLTCKFHPNMHGTLTVK